jgi:hypothetical protein
VIWLPSDTGRPGGSALIGACAGRPPADGCAGRSVCLYNPDLDPGRHGAGAVISYITQAITASNQPAHYGRALIRRSVLEWTFRSGPLEACITAFFCRVGHLLGMTAKFNRRNCSV